jgi:methyl-accepting chemotaxis protein
VLAGVITVCCELALRAAGLPAVVITFGLFLVVAGLFWAVGRGPDTTVSGTGPDHIDVVADRVHHETESMNSSIEQLSAEANSIAFNMMLQVGASDSAKESLEQLSESISRVNELAEQTEQRSQRVSELVVDGEVRAKGAVEEMDHLVGTFRDVEERVQPLVQQAGEIGTAAELIQRIASQTKLLSLNATIEAVRAGERGAGFAVVAEEVRKLADAASTAALTITRAVTGIQAGTTSVADGIGSASGAVQSGRDHVQGIFDVLVPIHQEADGTFAGSREVSQSISSERDLIGQVVDAVGQVLAMSGETQTVVDQALATAAEMSQATEAITGAVAPLRDRIVDGTEQQQNQTPAPAGGG